MDPRDKAWLQANRSILVDAHYRLEDLLDQLIQEGIFDTFEDDYQLIMCQDTPRGQLRKLLDILPLKKAESFLVFKNAMRKLCPHILERCMTPKLPKTRLGQLQELLTGSRKLNSTMRGPTPWLGSKGKLHAHRFSLDLFVVDHDDLAKSVTEQTSTTATEQTRRDDRYTRPRTRKTIPFQSLFQLTNPSQQRTDPVHSRSGEAATSRPTVPRSAQPSSSSVPNVVVSSRQEASTGAEPLCTHNKMAVWAGAGCGKTGTCHHVAMLHSEGQLWPFFEALLLWRLREPAVQSATSLVQLLAVLLPDTPESKLEEFADAIFRCNGRGILAVVDGVDEFIERKNSYVCRLLNGEVLTGACLLATSRPCDAARNIFQSASSVFDANVELLGFSDKQVDAFIDESLGSKLAPELKELLDKSPSLASLMSVPLLAVLVSQVFESSPDLSLSTRTRLYSTLVLLVLRHAVNEGRIAVSDMEKVSLKAAKDAHQLPVGVARKLLMDHGKVAWSAFQKDKAIFDTNFIAEEGKWESLGPLALGLLDCYYSTGDALTEVIHYTFQHLAIQEFLAAFFLAKTIHDKRKLETTLTSVCQDPKSFVVLQFLAGLLKRDQHSLFFRRLSQWLNNPHLRGSIQQERLRVCLQCAQEACGGDAYSFPQLILPKKVILFHVTASDLTMLGPAVLKSSTINELQLDFHEITERDKSDSRFSRRQRQTCSAMASLITAVSHNRSLRCVVVRGPKYKLLDETSLPLLTRQSRLKMLHIFNCGVENIEVGWLPR